MYYLPVAFGVWLHVFFWGAGGAILIMPRPWRRCWPVLALAVGFALQSLVVWLGAYANLRGTDAYAGWTEALPAALLLIALLRRRSHVVAELWSFRGLWSVMAANLVALVLPLALATRGLTTLSFGSCDAADYAAGARVLKEFAHGDRTGFLGLTEVVHVASVDNFFDFWLRLNHFTPSALIAFNGTILDCSPSELTSVLTAVLLVGSLPVVFWLARAVLGYGPRVSLWVSAIYGLSPVAWYAVFHVAMGQLLAGPAIGLVTWAGVALWRGRLSRGAATRFAGVLVVAYALILGGYNFILLVALVPALAYAGGWAVWHRAWRRFARWLLAMLVPLLAAGLVFWERVAGLAERFLLFQTYDFGWRIPFLTPEGWLGLVADHELTPLRAGIRWSVMALVVAVTLGAWIHAVRRRRRGPYLVACLTLPVLAGYAFLTVRGQMLGTNASYDAYKILAVFYPGLLPALVCWAAWGVVRAGATRLWTLAAMGAVLAGNLGSAWHFAERVQIAPLTVSRELRQLQVLEQEPEIGSLNLLVMDGWSRLWANALLLRTPQYFQTHTYEGRLNTPLRGAWDLVGGFVRINLPDGASRPLSQHYTLLDTQSPYLARINLTDGWFEPEQSPASAARWIWTKGASSFLRIDNPQKNSLQLRWSFELRSLVQRHLEVWLNGKNQGTVSVGLEATRVAGPIVNVGPGTSVVELRSAEPVTGSAADSRPLGFCVYGIAVDVLPNSDTRAK